MTPVLLPVALVFAQVANPLTPDLDAERVAAVAQAGGAYGIGPGYRLEADPEGFEVTARLGRGAERAGVLRLELLEVGRGEVLEQVGAARVSAASRSVELRRSGALTETLELRTDGVKHSLVFDALPGGSGDLCARFALGAEGLDAIEEVVEGRDTLRLDGRSGGLRIGSVLGVDASGEMAAGSLGLIGDVLELRLPAEFVDAAELPLVLDPLIGSYSTLGTSGENDAADAAYLPGVGWLVVHEISYSATDRDVVGWRVGLDGGAFGDPIKFETGPDSESEAPCVTADPAADAWVVAFERSRQNAPFLDDFLLVANGVRSDGLLGPELLVGVTQHFGWQPDLGGAGENDGSLLAYRSPAGQIRAVRLAVDGAAAASQIGFGFAVSDGFNDGSPAVSEQPGSLNGEWLVAWESRFGAFGPRDVKAVLVSGGGTVLGTPSGLWDDPTIDEYQPVVATGRFGSFVAAASVGESVISANFDVRMQRITSTIFGGLGGVESALRAVPGRDERAASLTYVGTSIAAAVEVRQGVAEPFIELGAIDPDGFGLCQPFEAYSPPAEAESAPVLASAWPDRSECLVALTAQQPDPALSRIGLQRFRPAAGTLVPELIGACGQERTVIHCPQVGNPNFRIALEQGAGSLTNFLLISQSRIDLPCGACLIAPNPFSGSVIEAPSTVFSTSVSVNVTIPPGASGKTFFVQWLIAGDAGAACASIGLDPVPPVVMTVD